MISEVMAWRLILSEVMTHFGSDDGFSEVMTFGGNDIRK